METGMRTGIRVITQVVYNHQVKDEYVQEIETKTLVKTLTARFRSDQQKKTICKYVYSKTCDNADAEGNCAYAYECSYETNFLYKPTEEAAKKMLEYIQRADEPTFQISKSM